MKKMQNNVHLEGYVFSHSLEMKVTGENSKNPNTPYIRGSVEIATDDAGLNVVPVYYTYVTEFAKTGKQNPTYQILKEICDGNIETYQTRGTQALKVRIDCEMRLNDWFGRDGELVSNRRAEGGFIHKIIALPPDVNLNRNKFILDFLITSVIMKEVEDGEDYMEVRGYGFDFANRFLPTTLTIKDPNGIKYLEKLEVSEKEPALMNLWGCIVCTTIVSKNETQDPVFGENLVQTSTRTFREWLITGAATSGDFGEEGIVTAEEMTKGIAERNVALEEMKKRNEEYKAAHGEKPAFGTPTAAPKTTAGFKF